MTEEELNELMHGPEVWWPIPRFPMYEASNHGRVRSWNSRARSNGYKPPAEPRVMKPSKRSKGYLHLVVCNSTGHYTLYVHELVLEAFCGPRPAGWVVRHMDGNPENNHLSNLCWGTYRENAADKFRHGTQPLGEKHVKAKLTDEQVLQARAEYSSGTSTRTLAARYGVSETCMRKAITGRSWGHLSVVSA